MTEIWCGDEKIADWAGANLPSVGDEVAVELDGEDYDAAVKRVFKRHDKNGATTQIVEIDDPRPFPFFVGR